jgi:transcriptional regulator with XRE-family HTH domain
MRLAVSLQPAAASALRRLGIEAGRAVREERLRRGWTLHDVAVRAGVATTVVQRIEAGQIASLESYVRVAVALGLRPELLMADGRAKRMARSHADLVHSAIGEAIAARMAGHGFGVAIDEPYQHYQFAGRADLLAWDLDRRALLHVENRTRFPDLQEAAGSFNAKRRYLPAVVAERLGISRWGSVTNAIVALWSSEVLHVLRLRRATFTALCPDGPGSFASWWTRDPQPVGARSELVVFDRVPTRRARQFIGLDEAMRADPRHRGYADAAGRSRAAQPEATTTVPTMPYASWPGRWQT